MTYYKVVKVDEHGDCWSIMDAPTAVLYEPGVIHTLNPSDGPFLVFQDIHIAMHYLRKMQNIGYEASGCMTFQLWRGPGGKEQEVTHVITTSYIPAILFKSFWREGPDALEKRLGERSIVGTPIVGTVGVRQWEMQEQVTISMYISESLGRVSWYALPTKLREYFLIEQALLQWEKVGETEKITVARKVLGRFRGVKAEERVGDVLVQFNRASVSFVVRAPLGRWYARHKAYRISYKRLNYERLLTLAQQYEREALGEDHEQISVG